MSAGNGWHASVATLLRTHRSPKRDVPLTPRAASELRKIFDQRSQMVFRGQQVDTPASRDAIRWALTKASTAAGLPRLRVHDTRPSFASPLASGGVSMRKLGELLGDSTTSVVERHAHLSDESLQDGITVLDLAQIRHKREARSATVTVSTGRSGIATRSTACSVRPSSSAGAWILPTSSSRSPIERGVSEHVVVFGVGIGTL